MTTPDESEFSQAADAIAEERYGGDRERGFAHLAYQLAFPTFSFSDDQADDATSIDRPGDLGADAMFIAEEERQILFFQAKSSPGLGDSQLHDFITAFRSVPSQKLTNDKWLTKAHQDMRALANEFRMAVRADYEILFAFATASPLSPLLRATFPEQEHLDLAGQKVLTSTALLDNLDLESRYRKLLLSEYGGPTNVALTVKSNQIHTPASLEPVVYLTVEAREFVKECKPYGDELFRFNPRLYLGSNKVNDLISQTLKNPQMRRYFHLLNNGITAVCTDFTIVEAGDEQLVVRVEDFQVVNGCQTSMTLFLNSSHFQDDPDCLVDVKVIQSPGLRSLVSEATNTQTAIVAEDAFSNEPEQRRIHELLDRHAPPYHYSSKRGTWEALPNTATGKRRYLSLDAAFGRYRRLTSKELAAVFLAIFGEPGSAKDKPRVVFEKVDGKNSPAYVRIFCARNVAAQWLLPFEMLRHANAAVRREKERDPDSHRGRVGQYGRYWMLYLAYSLLANRVSAASNECLDATPSERFLNSTGAWAPQVMDLTLDALVDAYDDALAREQSSGLREFFRETKHHQAILDRFDKALGQLARLAEREGKTLGQRIGFDK